jgi:hypothetical protein
MPGNDDRITSSNIDCWIKDAPYLLVKLAAGRWDLHGTRRLRRR